MKLTITPPVADPATFSRLDEHPRIQAARRALAEARSALATASSTHTSATVELAAAETDAAVGRRDDKRLARIRQTLQDADSEQRIRLRAVELAEERVATVVSEVQREVFANLNGRRLAALRAMDGHLQRARDESGIAAALEDDIRRLLPSGMYSGTTEFAIESLAWRREFAPGARYDAWRECCGLFPKDR